jgi:hypothetical protein
MYIFYEPVYYDHAAIVAVTVVDGAIIMVAIVNTVPVAAAIAKSHRFSHCHFYLIVVCSRNPSVSPPPPPQRSFFLLPLLMVDCARRPPAAGCRLPPLLPPSPHHHRRPSLSSPPPPSPPLSLSL